MLQSEEPQAVTSEPTASPAVASPEPMEVDESDLETGTVLLPLSRVRRIFKMDPMYVLLLLAAVFATTVATELFVQYLVEQSVAQARQDRRKKLQYRDVALAVRHVELLQFLSDTVPTTVMLLELVALGAVLVGTTGPRDPDPTGEVDTEVEDGELEEEAGETPAPVTKPVVLPRGQQTLQFGRASASEPVEVDSD